jgi:hypothetical protein
VLAVVVFGALGVAAANRFFTARDTPVVPPAASATDGPGRAVTPASRDPRWTADAALLRRGNVVLAFGRAADGPALRRLAGDVAGPPSAALRSTGQAVVVRRLPGRGGVVARSFDRELDAASADDPRLRLFVEAMLGRRPGG